ncbi:baseplate J/gp47 family protein [Paraburkholderia phosphatilytica]|uniref:baseplate J/gp47 family protein n=1 Tax=Paraburkholderia phosphatilytica TaxID=2282883 RepID=UPI000E4FC55A|nr:baseplate J/gp47 family protein [Paraburkholderia phosphatilytica]
MTVQQNSFSQFLSGFASTVQGKCSTLLNFVIGSVIRSIGEATSWMGVWLQSLVLQGIALTRAASSNGPDLDSWLAQFGFSRLAPTAASGNVTFSRFTPTNAALIPVGSIVQTQNGALQYQVVENTSNAAWDATNNGYDLPAGTSSVSVPVTCITPGSNSLSLPDASGNVSENAINALYQSIPGVDTVTNPLAFTNGENAESDAAARIRFVAWLASLSKATKAAILAAILVLGDNFACNATENYTKGGTYQPGYFYVIVDDGTGNPTSTVLSTVYSAVDAVRPFTSTFGVFGPSILNASIVMAIETTSTGVGHVATAALVQTAITNYVNALVLGQSLSYFRLGQIALDTSPDVISITLLTLNGVTVDLTATNQQVIKLSSIAVT